MPARLRSTTLATALLAGLLSASGSVTGPARATDGSAAAVGTAAAATPSGCWMVASDGGVFSFGDAKFFGSTGNIKLNKPIVGMAATPTGRGYWLVASDGGIFSFGDARFYGSTGGSPPPRPVSGMAATPNGRGYWLTTSGGRVFAFGEAKFAGNVGPAFAAPCIGIVSAPGGYRLVDSRGNVFHRDTTRAHTRITSAAPLIAAG